MAIEVLKESVCVNKLVCEKKEIIFVEGDCIIPDSKPDILKTINMSGIVSCYKRELLENKMRLDGNINVYAMYLADSTEDNVRGINANLDFSETINLPEANSGMIENTSIEIKSIESKILNGRKVSFKATLEIFIKVYSNENVDIISKIENDRTIQTLSKTIDVNSLIGTGSTKVYIKENIKIEQTDNLAEILKANINLVDKDIKISYNKVLAKTEAEVKVVYLTEDNRLNTVINKIPVVGFIDIQNISDGNICDVDYQVKNIILKPNSIEEHSIYIEMEIEAICSCYEERKVNVIEDLYSISEDIRFTNKNVRIVKSKREIKDIYKFKQNIQIPEIENKNIIDTQIKPIITKEETIGNKISYTGDIEIKFIYSANGILGLDTKIIKLPFEHMIENVEDIEKIKFESKIELIENDFVIQTGGNMDINLTFNFNIMMYQNSNLNIIENLEEEENRDLEDYSVIIYIVKKDDTLWKIAKEFKSTIDDIVRTNGLEDKDKIYPGQKIYIPRYVIPKNLKAV